MESVAEPNAKVVFFGRPNERKKYARSTRASSWPYPNMNEERERER